MKLAMGPISEPLFYAATRMTILMLVLLPWLKWHEGLMRYVLCAAMGYGVLNYAFMFPAMEMTTASAAAITIELYVPFSIILSVIVFGDRIGLYRVAGIALALIGVTIIAFATPSEAAGPYFLLGICFMACAAMSEAIGAIFVKKATGVNPLQLLAWFSVAGTLCLWPLTFALETDQLRAFSPENRLNFIMAMTYTTLLVSIVAHGSYYWLLQRLPIYIVSTSGLMTTIIGVIAGVLILKDPLTQTVILGAILTLAGVALILWRNTQKQAETGSSP